MSLHNKEASSPAGWRVSRDAQALFMCVLCWKSHLQGGCGRKVAAPASKGAAPTTTIETTGRDDSCELVTPPRAAKGASLGGFVEARETFTSICPLVCAAGQKNIFRERAVAVGTPNLIAALQRLSVALTETETLRLLPLCLLR